MRFCQDHWDRMRAAIAERDLNSLIAPDGKTAAMQLVQQAETGDVTPTDFDPLMHAHWAIVNNVFSQMDQAGASPLYLMAGHETPEDPVNTEAYGMEFDGRTWPRCPLCYLNLAHELSCKDARCTLDQERGYDWMIERAADDQAARARELRPEP